VEASEYGNMGRYSDFLDEFSHIVDEEGVSDVVGLRLLSLEERARASDPNSCDYEVNDDREDAQVPLITLSMSSQVQGTVDYVRVSWTIPDGIPRVRGLCFVGEGHILRPRPGK
jgi:hypothetical protein